jgi:hypothetical protein
MTLFPTARECLENTGRFSNGMRLNLAVGPADHFIQAHKPRLIFSKAIDHLPDTP